jgi:hypothetical protein
VLHVRAEPNPEAVSLVELPWNESDLHPSGSVCVGSGSPWFEVDKGNKRGWVSSQFVDFATGPEDVTAESGSRLARSTFRSVDGLLSAAERHLAKEHSDMGPAPEVRRIGVRIAKQRANAVLSPGRPWPAN